MRQHALSILLILGCLGFATVYAQEAVICPGAPPPRLTVGEQGQMAPGPANNLRAEPSTRGDYMGQLEAGDIFQVLAGPVCADGYAWWLVDRDGLIGWSAEGVNRDYWLEPYLPAETTLAPSPTPFITPTAPLSAAMEAVFSDAPYYYDLTLEPNEQVIALLSSAVSGMPPYLYVMNPHGGNVRMIAMEDVGYPVWSPDGSQLLWRGRESFYVWDVNAGITYGTALGDPISGDYGWLPDSTEIFFASADANTGFLDILVMPVDAGGIDNLTTHPSNDRQASWSPDGQTMVFLSDRSGNGELYRVDRDRHNLTQLTASGFNNWPVWSPDGSRIAWIDGQKMMTMSPDGSNIITWVDDDVANFRPVWSPDGTKIVYIGLTDVGLSGIHILDMNGGATVVVPADYSDDPHASWSPDSTQLVFQVYDGVYRVNADGTGLTKIAQPIDWVAWMAWRPGER